MENFSLVKNDRCHNLLCVLFSVCESNIQEKKDYISTTHKSLSRLSEEVQQKQNTLRFIKENTKKYGEV